MPKVLILAGDAAESLEVLYPYQRLRQEGLRGAHRRQLQFVLHDFAEGFHTHRKEAVSCPRTSR